MKTMLGISAATASLSLSAMDVSRWLCPKIAVVPEQRNVNMQVELQVFCKPTCLTITTVTGPLGTARRHCNFCLFVCFGCYFQRGLPKCNSLLAHLLLKTTEFLETYKNRVIALPVNYMAPLIIVFIHLKIIRHHLWF